LFQQALNLYKQQQWQAALILFDQLASEFPKEPCFQVYRQRVVEKLGKAHDPAWMALSQFWGYF